MGLKKRQPEWIFIFICACFSLLFSQAIFSESLDAIARKICAASDKLKKPQIAVLPFPYHDGAVGSASTIISEKLLTKIVARKKFQVIERSLLEKVLSELKLQNSGAIDQETAKKLGNVLGVEALLTGTLIDLGGGRIEINARLIHAESGLVLAAADEEVQRTWQEEKIKKSADAAQPESGDVKDKMSVFFHSREWKDPRFHSEDEGRAAPENNPVVLSNAGEFAAASLDGEEKMVDSPDELNSFEKGTSNEIGPADMERIRAAWEFAKKKDFDKMTSEFSKLKEEFESHPRRAALALLYLSEGYFKKGEYQAAFRHAKQSWRLADSRRVKSQAIFMMARSQEELGKFGLAAGFYRDLLQNHPYEARLIRQSGHRMRAHARRRP